MTALEAIEQLIAERIERAERLLAAQKRRVLELQGRGLDPDDAQALLKLMESVAEQFYVTWQLFQAYEQPTNPEGGAEPPTTEIAAAPCSAAASTGQAVASASDVPCPHCGLKLDLQGPDGNLSYDIGEWHRRCRYPTLQTPVLCQLLRQQPQTVH